MGKIKTAPAPAAAPLKRSRRTREDILARIFEAAADAFKRDGYAGATTAAIARQADVTEAQLFRYFPSKEALFRETIFKPIDQHFSSFMAAHKNGGGLGSEEINRLYTSELHDFIRDNAEMLTSLLVAQAYDKGVQGAGPIENLQAYFEHGAATLRETHKGKPKTDPKIIVRIAFATVLANVIFRRWIFPPGLASDAALKSAINHFIMAGVDANFEDEKKS